MTFDPKSKKGYGDATTNMVHELGHAFGLVHEHQRPDASQHVKFNCDNLYDYDKQKKDGQDMQTLCTNRYAAANARFSAADMIPYDSDEPYPKSDIFDMNSIMRYNTYIGSKNPKGLFKKKVLVDLRGDELRDVTGPSRLDVERVNELYS
ncbi:hypothetical protein MMC16_002810 [Acarospora aff. strigata]|nr:hypothetical protein [Acarospora aff. strigata]